MSIKIILQERDQQIQISRGQMIIYAMPLSRIDEVIQPGNIAKHILHLLNNYKLENHDCLYSLARVIQAQVPDNEINWVSTFIIVEQFFDSQKFYQDKVKFKGFQKKYHRKFLGLPHKTRLERDTPENRSSMEILARQNLKTYQIPITTELINQSDDTRKSAFEKK